MDFRCLKAGAIEMVLRRYVNFHLLKRCLKRGAPRLDTLLSSGVQKDNEEHAADNASKRRVKERAERFLWDKFTVKPNFYSFVSPKTAVLKSAAGRGGPLDSNRSKDKRNSIDCLCSMN